MQSDEYAIVLLPGDRAAQVWPTGGRDSASFEAHCATCGVTVIRSYSAPEDALEALCLSIENWFAKP